MKIRKIFYSLVVVLGVTLIVKADFITTLYDHYTVSLGASASELESMPKMAGQIKNIWKLFKKGKTPEEVKGFLEYQKAYGTADKAFVDTYASAFSEWESNLPEDVRNISEFDASKAYSTLIERGISPELANFFKQHWESFKALINRFRLQVAGIGDKQAIEKAGKLVNSQLEKFGLKLGEPVENLIVKMPKGFAKNFVANPEGFDLAQFTNQVNFGTELQATYESDGLEGLKSMFAHDMSMIKSGDISLESVLPNIEAGEGTSIKNFVTWMHDTGLLTGDQAGSAVSEVGKSLLDKPGDMDAAGEQLGSYLTGVLEDFF